MNYLINRLKEASTWRGIILCATSVLQVSIGEEVTNCIVAAGVGLVGIVSVILPDKLKGEK